MKLALFILLSSFLFADVGSVYKVIDGDTIHLKSGGEVVKCRIAFIDTPEKSRNARAKRFVAQCKGLTLDTMIKAGKEAKEYAKRHFKKGQRVKFHSLEKDRYGRDVCVMGDYNLQIVRDGFAVPYWRYIPADKKREFKKASMEAKRGAGLWKSYPAVMECLSK